MQARGLTLQADRRILVDGLDFDAGPGECWVVIGRNGAGKSTLLQALAGLRKPAAGQALIDGRALPDWPLADLARRRAYLPQGRSDAFGYRVLDTVLAARHPYQDGYWDSDADRGLALQALAEMDAAHLAGRDVRTLSGGERQRVAIAAVLAQQTPLLLLDEPSGALDLAHQVALMQRIAGLCGEGRTVLMVAHDLNMVDGVASHALLLSGEGRWRAGTVEAMMQPGLLEECLGHPIAVLRHEGRRIYLPREGVAGP
ncbi:ABC transporter ATP-binding protein [Noviherbaspirillum suwonense]|jgi:iron complex transport system ATP-binding protein|uniref:Iron complex transport system ATP-binding protein n=1 Tax=Noviherbaspirillum suwonense TaxID=1224511 RepID=A0ABY1QM45_9BURK|nr:ABC transporter ATP-binding protein [Noviherbaspirillum suwonense]SMP72120.1 iron complex transport system ATP-binding protein [Noviherbaspirillum suwonense]